MKYISALQCVDKVHLQFQFTSRVYVCVLSLHPLSHQLRDSICSPFAFIIYLGADKNMSIALDDKQNTLSTHKSPPTASPRFFSITNNNKAQTASHRMHAHTLRQATGWIINNNNKASRESQRSRYYSPQRAARRFFFFFFSVPRALARVHSIKIANWFFSAQKVALSVLCYSSIYKITPLALCVVGDGGAICAPLFFYSGRNI